MHDRTTGRSIVVGVAVANAIARIYLGAHNPLDVVGGTAVGIALGIAITMAVGTPTSSTRPVGAPIASTLQ